MSAHPSLAPAPPSAAQRAKRRRWLIACVGAALAAVAACLAAAALTGAGASPARPALSLSGEDDTSFTAVAFSPNGKIQAAGKDGNVYFWNPATARLTATLTSGRPIANGVVSVAFSRDGTMLAAGGENGSAYLWHTLTRIPAGVFHVPGEVSATALNPVSVAFSPDGRILATGDGDGGTYLWTPATGKRIAAFTGGGCDGAAAASDGYGASVAFSPDGRTLAVIEGAPTARDPGPAVTKPVGACLRNMATGKLIATITDPSGIEVSSVAFGPDGRTLAFADSDDGFDPAATPHAYVWDVAWSA
jgi:WD40 repeat protein